MITDAELSHINDQRSFEQNEMEFHPEDAKAESERGFISQKKKERTKSWEKKPGLEKESSSVVEYDRQSSIKLL